MTKNEESGKTRRTSSDSCKNQKNHTRAWRKTNISNIAPSGANNWFSVANNWFSVAIRFHKIYLFGPESGKVVRSKPKLAGHARTYSWPSSIQENSTDPQAIVFRGVRFWLFFEIQSNQNGHLRTFASIGAYIIYIYIYIDVTSLGFLTVTLSWLLITKSKPCFSLLLGLTNRSLTSLVGTYTHM